MKASIKFRDEQKPLIRAKVPLSILGFPFQSGVVAGDSKELSLNLSTFFDSGPSLKLAYRPNDSFNPFSLVFKSGIGHFGSPVSSSVTMSAEFDFIGKRNPRFFVNFKPRIGDFMLKKSQSSDFVARMKVNGAVPDEEKVAEAPAVSNGDFLKNDLFSGEKFSVNAGVVKGYLSGTEVTARTSVPVRSYAEVNFRWGVRLPQVEDVEAKTLLMKSERTAEISLKRFPVLVMNKISIEHVAVVKDKGECDQLKEGTGSDNVAEAYLDVRRQLEAIQVENGKMRRAMEDLSSEIIKDRKEVKFSSRADRKSPEFTDFEISNKS
ncbi:hypothetical protein DCAR_0626664 [Daucus carota subsp. sativus]|uniref:Uncharacterized protein n=1 Tax=Daucus carota subsp. sativus TaxID=79200 RepID=A0A164X742_DAUCS|nr:PREDICTED: uncharacterized protein LOC108224659 [Daucus carota subsp. sativus]WOH07235.1 hypothetical protein DCAR_0626664 [Daucus carota subsp. sativus]